MLLWSYSVEEPRRTGCNAFAFSGTATFRDTGLDDDTTTHNLASGSESACCERRSPEVRHNTGDTGMTNCLLSTQEAGDILDVTRATMSLWRQNGGGPAFENSPAPIGFHARTLYVYRLDAVLAYLASHGTSKTDLAAIKLHTITTRRLKLAREADKARMTAMSAIRRAHAARATAADAGHAPSVKILAPGRF